MAYSKFWLIENQRHIQSSGIFRTLAYLEFWYIHNSGILRTRGIFRTLAYSEFWCILNPDILRTRGRLRHIKNKGVQQSHASSRNLEAIDVWKVARHPPSRQKNMSKASQTVFYVCFKISRSSQWFKECLERFSRMKYSF